MLNAIVAACANKGIGKNGTLPWNLPKEFKHFVRLTIQTTNSEKQNAVIMGRLTWESIPKNFRPLKHRKNIVLSKSLPESSDYCLADTLDKAVELAKADDSVESIWIIGGASVYREAFFRPDFNRLYLTSIRANFDCDVFLPDLPAHFSLIDSETVGVSSEIQTEKGLDYVFEVYENLGK